MQGRVVERERRDRLFREGEPGNVVYVIGSGRVRLVRPSAKDLTVAYRGPGDLAGERILFSPTHDVEGLVVDRVRAVAVDAQQLQRAMEHVPELATRFYRMADARARELEDRLSAFLTKTVEERVSEFLLEAAERHGVADARGTLIRVKFTHLEIASYVGSTRETVTLVLGDLRRKGLIETDHRRVIVRDMTRLRSGIGAVA
ncbi:MAG: Crp/Fnr family transcriptional regulator [Myxococcota bacterium]